MQRRVERCWPTTLMAGALGEGGGAELGDDELRKPRTYVELPFLGGHRRTPGDEPGLLRRRHVLAQRLAVDPERLRHDELGPARVPVLEDLHDVDHSERPPYHLGSFRPVDARSVGGSETEVADFRPPARVGNSLTARLGNSLTGRVGNYLTELRPDWGIP